MAKRMTVGLPIAISAALVGGVVVAPNVIAEPAAEAPAPVCTTERVVEGGTLNWGVKQSFRQYITGSIARGDWTSEGITDNGKDKDSPDFQFIFDVDPKASKVEFDEQGNITSASVKTKQSSLIFEGHDGALYTEMHQPYIETSGNVAKPGTGYVGYYVPGKAMTQYTPADRTDANKMTGEDTFGQGKAEWSKDGEHYKLSATGMNYVAKPGTQYNSKTRELTIEGVDVLFLGMYKADYKPELDDATVDLTVKEVETCTSPEDPAKPSESSTPSTTAKPSESSTSSTTAKPSESSTPSTTAKPSEPSTPSTTAKPSEPSTPSTTSSAPAPKPGNGSSQLGGSLFTWILPALAAVGGIGAAIAYWLQSVGLLNGLDFKLPNSSR